MPYSKLCCVPCLEKRQADTKPVMITAPGFTARQKGDPCSCFLLIWLVYKQTEGGKVALSIPVVLSVYSDHATTGTANSPSRPAANCPVFAVLTELAELVEAGAWSMNACKSKDRISMQPHFCNKHSSHANSAYQLDIC